MDLREEGRDAGREGEEKKGGGGGGGREGEEKKRGGVMGGKERRRRGGGGGGGHWEGREGEEKVLQFLCTFEWFEWLPRKT